MAVPPLCSDEYSVPHFPYDIQPGFVNFKYKKSSRRSGSSFISVHLTYVGDIAAEDARAVTIGVEPAVVVFPAFAPAERHAPQHEVVLGRAVVCVGVRGLVDVPDVEIDVLTGDPFHFAGVAAALSAEPDILHAHLLGEADDGVELVLVADDGEVSAHGLALLPGLLPGHVVDDYRVVAGGESGGSGLRRGDRGRRGRRRRGGSGSGRRARRRDRRRRRSRCGAHDGDGDLALRRRALRRSALGNGGSNGITRHHGQDGRGIYDISLNNAGELIITLSDNTVYNLGTITGADGKDGTDGKDGENGKDGTNGVDGKDGRGIEKVDLVDETLIIYYTDGSVQNVETVIGTPAASDEYTVAFVADGKIVSIENYSSADSDINVPNVPEKDGYIGRWENYTLAVGDLTVNAIYTPDVYELDVSMIGNYGKINGAGNYYFGETVSISVEVYPGYEFIGWYENDVLISDEVNYSFTMPDNDISYTAKFTLQKELLPFEFTISESGCTITGVTNSMATELIIPDYVIRVDDGALSECKELTSLTLPFGDKPIWMYFSDTAVSVPSTLKELTFSEGVTEICASALEGCNALTDIFLPSTITEIGNNVFESCADAKLHISNLETWCSVNSESQIYPISEIVLDGNILTDIIIPDGVARIGVNTFASYMNATKVVIPESVLLIGANAFNGNGNLNYIEIDNGVIMIGNFAFSSCGSIENVVLPDSVTTLGNSVFSGSKLQSIVLSEGMDSIAWGTFNYCSDLKQIVIPDSITYVSENAFNYCNALSKVYYEGSQTGWDNITIDENNGGLINAVKYYYSENEPLEAGNYWHYAEDGITPVEW